MVDLCAAGQSRRSAAIKVAAALKIDWETLRKHYRELEQSGRLPKSLPPGERRAEAIREQHRRFTATVEETRQEIATLEQEAESLGLDLRDAKFGDLIQFLDRRKEHLETLTTTQDIGWLYGYFRMEGIPEPEDIIAYLGKATQDLARIIHEPLTETGSRRILSILLRLPA